MTTLADLAKKGQKPEGTEPKAVKPVFGTKEEPRKVKEG